MRDSVVNGAEKKIGAKAEKERKEVRRQSAKKRIQVLVNRTLKTKIKEEINETF